MKPWLDVPDLFFLYIESGNEALQDLSYPKDGRMVTQNFLNTTFLARLCILIQATTSQSVHFTPRDFGLEMDPLDLSDYLVHPVNHAAGPIAPQVDAEDFEAVFHWFIAKDQL